MGATSTAQPAQEGAQPVSRLDPAVAARLKHMNSVDGNLPAVAVQRGGSAASIAALPAGWEAFTTEDGVPYYYHAASGVSSWDPPTTA